MRGHCATHARQVAWITLILAGVLGVAAGGAAVVGARAPAGVEHTALGTALTLVTILGGFTAAALLIAAVIAASAAGQADRLDEELRRDDLIARWTVPAQEWEAFPCQAAAGFCQAAMGDYSGLRAGDRVHRRCRRADSRGSGRQNPLVRRAGDRLRPAVLARLPAHPLSRRAAHREHADEAMILDRPLVTERSSPEPEDVARDGHGGDRHQLAGLRLG